MIRTLQLDDIPRIVTDRQRFDEIVYTPLAEAREQLMRRQHDTNLTAKILAHLGGDILEPLSAGPRAVVARSVMSPNYEVRRFTELAGQCDGLEPLFLEYHADKFASNNESKRMIGRLYFFNGNGKSGVLRTDSVNIINFSSSNGLGISSVETLWGQKLTDFHHEFFDEQFERRSHTFVDASRWLRAHGGSAEFYYRAFLTLFVQHGILFENILLNNEEISFTSHVFLPAFVSVYRQFGLKPLIVPLTPTDKEESPYWMCYPGPDKRFITEKLCQSKKAAA